MGEKNRLSSFIKLQNKNIKFKDIAKELNISESTLRRYLNKQGYISKNGIYELKKEEQITFKESTLKEIKDTKTSNKIKQNDIAKNKKSRVHEITKEEKTKNTVKEKSNKNKLKRDKKINITQEDIDNLYEVYDWYLQVKDMEIYTKQKRKSKKDIVVELEKITNLKSTSIRVDKDTWEDFERLCSNSSFGKQEILTQALKEFIKKYKNLI